MQGYSEDFPSLGQSSTAQKKVSEYQIKTQQKYVPADTYQLRKEQAIKEKPFGEQSQWQEPEEQKQSKMQKKYQGQNKQYQSYIPEDSIQYNEQNIQQFHKESQEFKAKDVIENNEQPYQGNKYQKNYHQQRDKKQRNYNQREQKSKPYKQYQKQNQQQDYEQGQETTIIQYTVKNPDQLQQQQQQKIQIIQEIPQRQDKKQLYQMKQQQQHHYDYNTSQYYDDNEGYDNYEEEYTNYEEDYGNYDEYAEEQYDFQNRDFQFNKNQNEKYVQITTKGQYDQDFDRDQIKQKEKYHKKFNENQQLQYEQYQAPQYLKNKILNPTIPIIEGNYTVLMIAEKPSIALSIAEALSGKYGYKTKKGKMPVHEYKSAFKGRSAFFRVSSVIGHVFTTDFPSKYSDWNSIEPKKLFDVETIKKESNPKARIIQHIQKCSQNVNMLVLWLDNDLEGENICFEVLGICEKQMPKENFNQIYRAKFSSITKQDLQEAFENLKDGPNQNEAIAVDARQIIDLKIGVSFSRQQTMYFTEKYDDLRNMLISYGPCQTPALGFCVDRMDEIQKFKPQLFYKIVPTISYQQGGFLDLKWEEKLTFVDHEAQNAKKEVEGIGEAQVMHVIIEEQRKGRPEGLNTSKLLQICSGSFGIGPLQAMKLAEKLYLSGFITYPRTESTSYPKKFNFLDVIKAITITNNNKLSEYSHKLLKFGLNNPRRGVDAGDHPPITPTTKQYFASQNSDEGKLYAYICEHFLASTSNDVRYENRIVKFLIGNHKFKAKGIKVIDAGFTEIMPWKKISDKYIPDFKQQQIFKVVKCNIITDYTKAPNYLTETELIQLMEQNRIGTDASMATHINNIQERDFVKVQGNDRRLVPTLLGINLIHGYQDIDNDLVAPHLRSHIEKRVFQIAIFLKGEQKFEKVLSETIEIFKNKFEVFMTNIQKMDKYFCKSFDTTEDNLEKSQNFSKCGKCNRFMKYLIKKQRLHCETCKQEYDLPKNGHIKLYGQKFCPLDKFQLIAFQASPPVEISYSICPKCYNDNPFENIEDIQIKQTKKSKLPCNICPNKDCEFSLEFIKIGECAACEKGFLVLDLPYGNKHTISCNTCTNHYVIAKAQATSKRLDKLCEQCDCYLISIKFSENKKDPSKTIPPFSGCIFCNEEYNSKYVTQEVQSLSLEQQQNIHRGRRGNRRGNRRGSRGSHRGGKRGRGGKGNKFQQYE